MRLTIFQVLTLLGSVIGVEEFKGVAPEKKHLYEVPVLFCPGNPSKKLTKEMINDDFCDCPEDGFDEPGTSACSNVGKFYCKNDGYFGEEISSMFVNDGVCDCCDGSDEPAEVCPNTCKELKRAFDQQEKEWKERLDKGIKSKNELIKKAAELREVHKRQLENGRLEIAAAENQLTVLKNIPELGLNEVPQEGDFESFCTNLQTKYEKVREIFNDLGESNDICKASEEAVKRFEDLETDKLSEIDAVLNDQVVDEAKTKTVWNAIKHLEFKDFLNLFKQYRATKTVTVTVQAGPTGVPKRDNPISEAESKIIQLKVKHKELEGKYSKQYGPEEVFLSLQDQCFDVNQEKYTYKLCFFGKVTQNEGKGSHAMNANFGTDLGKWKDWGKKGDGETDFTKMIYDEGAHCWNGPQRSTTVMLECGPETAILEVSEPSTCTYVMKVSSPAAC